MALTASAEAITSAAVASSIMPLTVSDASGTAGDIDDRSCQVLSPLRNLVRSGVPLPSLSGLTIPSVRIALDKGRGTQIAPLSSDFSKIWVD
jgi:hypothetical protein